MMAGMARRLWRSTCVVVLAVVAGCGGERAEGGGPRIDGGGEPASCLEPDRSCPDELPISAGPCEGDLVCNYTDYVYRCIDGAWVDEPLCFGCAPALAEVCREPFAGTLAGASVQIGPADGGAFRPFDEGERILPVFGAQGATMVAYRVRIEGEGPPDCLGVRHTVSLDTLAGAPAPLGVRGHCGETRRVFAVLPDNPCEFRDYTVDLAVEVDGVGATGVGLVLEGGGCPRTL